MKSFYSLPFLISCLLIPFSSGYAHKPSMVCQLAIGAALGTATGVSLGLLNKWYPAYHHPTFYVVGLTHVRALEELHHNRHSADIVIDIASLITATGWLIYLNSPTGKSSFAH